jgi:fructose-1,6-bisphosphatase II
VSDSSAVRQTAPNADIEQDLALDFVRVVEDAAIAAARTMGQGEGAKSDQVAVHAMRRAFERVPIEGTIVIGEGERDKAPMLYIGEPVGAPAAPGVSYPKVDIAVDPLEGTNLCATGASNSIAVLAASEPSGLLHAPDCYMEKIVAGPACRGALELDAPVEENLRAIAGCLDRDVSDLTIVVLDRERHVDLIKSIRATGARIRLIQDGDLSAGIAAAVRGAGVDAVRSASPPWAFAIPGASTPRATWLPARRSFLPPAASPTARFSPASASLAKASGRTRS